ncbi:MAG: cytochrome c oxidase assembly protein, partial [Alphaproteobacteria bacterium]|nr:cytochrome c oxidase assembly protein [Alphaproteobacteria bacterium]
MNDASAPSPYCGPAPVPADLWSAWNLDPVLLAVLGLGTVALALARAPQRRLYLAAALVVLILAFVTPLCALATALFSARVLHHVLLVAFAAPLLAMVILPTASRARTSLSLPFIAHLALLWVWHAPTPYAWALTGTAPYWLMELSLLGSAVWLWREILHPG